MEAAARRRVLITVRSVPGPNLRAALFRLVYGEEQLPAPGYRELLLVLWEMGILPDVRVLPGTRLGVGCAVETGLPQTREQAVEMALQGGWLRPEDRERARGVIEARYDELFAASPEGFRPLWHPGSLRSKDDASSFSEPTTSASFHAYGRRCDDASIRVDPPGDHGHCHTFASR